MKIETILLGVCLKQYAKNNLSDWLLDSEIK